MVTASGNQQQQPLQQQQQQVQQPQLPQLPPQQQGRIVCNGCYITLMYPEGASNVRCSQCGTITAVDPTQQMAMQQNMTRMAQLVCLNCRILLMYPRTANSVQCAMCGHVNPANGVGHIQCSGCRHMLMYELGAQSVKCALCEAITPASEQRGGSSSQEVSTRVENNGGVPGLGGGVDPQGGLDVQNPSPQTAEEEGGCNDVGGMVGMKTNIE
eukprot:TRINITY_DN46962_c0_g1_i2.p1 TRINITY_DN46962_c0_g1~~TRINITY_DN46962_c0_g1_i2.p1  ORF type:complete len:213 (-),score=29.88 TRINITY_DN46962_c0_g1_i2:232-870(-)